MTLYVYHYYDENVGPFINLSSLSDKEAEEISDRISEAGKTFASRRAVDYMVIRKELEAKARKMFIDKGGKPIRSYQDWNKSGEHGPERYIEVQIWNEQIVRRLRSDTQSKHQEEL